MGQSTDAILFYGYTWTEEAEPEELFGEDEWWEKVARRRGIASPYDNYPTEGEMLTFGRQYAPAPQAKNGGQARWQIEQHYKEFARKVWSFANDDAYTRWRSAEDEIRSEFGCDVGTHCSCDYPIPYIYVMESRVVAIRGYPKELDMHRLLHVSLDPFKGRLWTDLLDRFLEELEVEFPDPNDEYANKVQGPGWFLVSNWC